MIDTYSLLVAVLFLNISMTVVALLRRRTGYLAVYSTHALILLVLLSTVRVFVPLKFEFTHTVYSHGAIPAVETALQSNIWQGMVILDLLFIIWGAGSLVMLIFKARVILKELYYQKRYRPVDNTTAVIAAGLLRLKRAEIIVSPDVVVPYVTGLFKARIFLPDIDLSGDMLELILKHEYQHYKSGDIPIKIFYLMLSVVFWWNPVTHVFLRELDRLLEVRCDAALVRNMNDDEKTSYMESLLHITKHIQMVNKKTLMNVLSFAQTMQGGFMQQRFNLIQSSKDRKFYIMKYASIAVVVLIFCASFMINFQPVYGVLTEPLNIVNAVYPSSGPRPHTLDRQYTDDLRESRGLPLNNEINSGTGNDTPVNANQSFPRPRGMPMRRLSDEEIEQRGLGRNLTITDLSTGRRISTNLDDMRSMFTNGIFTGPVNEENVIDGDNIINRNSIAP